jgi:hypothetical protein
MAEGSAPPGPWTGRDPIGGDLGRDRARAQRPDEEPAAARQVTSIGQQGVDELAVLVNRPLQVGPPAGHLHIGLVGEPAVAGSAAAEPGRFQDGPGGEPLDPSADGEVINGDAALSDQFLDVRQDGP